MHWKSRRKSSFSGNSFRWDVVGRILLVVVCLFVMIGGWWWWQLTKTFNWKIDERLSIAWAAADGDVEHPVAVFSFAKDDRLVVLQLPDDVQASVASGYGNYEVRAWKDLAKQEKNYDLLGLTLTDLLGSPIHGWVISPMPDCNNLEPDCIKMFVFSWLKNSAESNVSWGDRLRLWWLVRNLRQDKIDVIDASEGSWARTEQTVDDKSVVVFDKNFIDARVAPLLVDPLVRKENLSVGVINTLQTSGLAHQAGRIVNGLGARVVFTNTENLNLEVCQLRAKHTIADSVTVRKLLEIFDCERVNEEGDERYDVEIKVGKQQLRWWKGN